MNVLIDTNILLDVLLDRQPWVMEASQIWTACETRRITGFIPASAMTDVFYVARRTTAIATAQIAVGLCLATFAIASVNRTVLERAVALSGHDFEDNVQLACAMVENLDAIVTRNPADFANSPISILTPAELRAQL